MKMRLSRAIVAMGLVTACSSSSSSPGGTSIAQACSDSAQARCIQIQTCSSTWLAELYGTEAACETRIDLECNNGLSAPQNANTPSNVEACVAQIPGWNCSDFLVGANPPSACAQVLGSAANGSPCSAAGQCQSGFCAYATSHCGTCAVQPTPGQACTGARQCGPGLECNAQNTCVVRAATGAACGPGIVCAPGDRCVKGTCETDTATANPGAACGSVANVVTGCVTGTCEPGAQAQPVCVARAAVGAACDDTNGPFCTPPALCVGGTCQEPTCP